MTTKEIKAQLNGIRTRRMQRMLKNKEISRKMFDNPYKCDIMSTDGEDDVEWITMHGTHVPIKGRKIVGGPDDLQGETYTQKSKGEPKTFGNRSRVKFVRAVTKAKELVRQEYPDKAWRVTAHTRKEMRKYAGGAKLHVTEGGSTIAVTKDGDIISVCTNPNDSKFRGKDLLRMAVENGGRKLDSYSGNHGFYVKCGFEPVSWCKWDDAYAPEDWDEKLGCKRENIIFYKYTGKTSKYLNERDFFRAVPASEDYDTAMRTRNESMERQ